MRKYSSSRSRANRKNSFTNSRNNLWKLLLNYKQKYISYLPFRTLALGEEKPLVKEKKKKKTLLCRVNSLTALYDRSLSLVSKSLTIEQDPEPVCIWKEVADLLQSVITIPIRHCPRDRELCQGEMRAVCAQLHVPRHVWNRFACKPIFIPSLHAPAPVILSFIRC